MLSTLRVMLVALVTAALALAQSIPYPELHRGTALDMIAGASSAVFTVVHADGTVESLHRDELVSFMAVADDGSLCTSFATSSDTKAVVPQGPLGGEPVPVLTTTWCDEKGVTHTVTTPIVSQTEAGLTKALALHDKLVAVMQLKHPPKVCPPPTPKVSYVLQPWRAVALRAA